MRLNQYLARHTTLSRRSADAAIADERVEVNGRVAQIGQDISADDQITLDREPVAATQTTTIALHKPVGYICSRRQQGNSPTIYELLPPELQHLSSIGRLDKDSSGLLIMTNNGVLSNALMHPRHEVEKLYEVELDHALSSVGKQNIEQGVELEDGPSSMKLDGAGNRWNVRLREGRNRQIRRTFAALGYQVTVLTRQQVGKLSLGDLAAGQHRAVEAGDIV